MVVTLNIRYKNKITEKIRNLEHEVTLSELEELSKSEDVLDDYVSDIVDHHCFNVKWVRLTNKQEIMDLLK